MLPKKFSLKKLNSDIEIQGEMLEESVLNENKIEIYANFFSNYFFEI